MTKTLALVFGLLLVAGWAVRAEAKSQKACEIGCAKYSGGHNATIYSKCMAKCLQK